MSIQAITILQALVLNQIKWETSSSEGLTDAYDDNLLIQVKHKTNSDRNFTIKLDHEKPGVVHVTTPSGEDIVTEGEAPIYNAISQLLNISPRVRSRYLDDILFACEPSANTAIQAGFTLKGETSAQRAFLGLIGLSANDPDVNKENFMYVTHRGKKEYRTYVHRITDVSDKGLTGRYYIYTDEPIERLRDLIIPVEGSITIDNVDLDHYENLYLKNFHKENSEGNSTTGASDYKAIIANADINTSSVGESQEVSPEEKLHGILYPKLPVLTPRVITDHISREIMSKLGAYSIGWDLEDGGVEFSFTTQDGRWINLLLLVENDMAYLHRLPFSKGRGFEYHHDKTIGQLIATVGAHEINLPIFSALVINLINAPVSHINQMARGTEHNGLLSGGFFGKPKGEQIVGPSRAGISGADFTELTDRIFTEEVCLSFSSRLLALDNLLSSLGLKGLNDFEKRCLANSPSFMVSPLQIPVIAEIIQNIRPQFKLTSPLDSGVGPNQ